MRGIDDHVHSPLCGHGDHFPHRHDQSGVIVHMTEQQQPDAGVIMQGPRVGVENRRTGHGGKLSPDIFQLGLVGRSEQVGVGLVEPVHIGQVGLPHRGRHDPVVAVFQIDDAGSRGKPTRHPRPEPFVACEFLGGATFGRHDRFDLTRRDPGPISARSPGHR